MFVSTYALAVYQAQSHCTFWSGFLFHKIQRAIHLHSLVLKPVSQPILRAPSFSNTMLLPPQPPSSRRYGRGCQGFPLCLPLRNPSGNDLKCGSSCSSIFHLSVSTQIDSSSELRKASRQGTGGNTEPMVHTNLKSILSILALKQNLWEVTGLHRCSQSPLFRNKVEKSLG